ncbi:MAG: ATP-binding protein [Myxococcales bacterium]|nr:ATP-binding protein [Myxococcales bacterium]
MRPASCLASGPRVCHAPRAATTPPHVSATVVVTLVINGRADRRPRRPHAICFNNEYSTRGVDISWYAGGVIERGKDLVEVRQLLKSFPIVCVIGPRQVGKTTLARTLAQERKTATRFDLEDPEDLARLDEPMLALAGLRGLVVIDEVQRRPELFPVLRVLADRPRRPARFLILGSASPQLLRQSSESLAGRIAYHELDGFALGEVGAEQLGRLWCRGGFPRSFLARSEAESIRWREEFLRTFLERDLAQIGIDLPALTLRRFWSMIAHYHAQTWNGSELGRSLGVSDTTVRRYLDAFTGTFAVRQLAPWHENLKKRQVKAPKVFVADTGLLHSLLGIRDQAALASHPKLGASWEGFALAQVVRRLGARPSECYFWATHQGAELDLLIVRGQKRLGFEIKRTSAPAVTRSMQIAQEDLKLDSLDLIHAGNATFPLAARSRAVALARIGQDLAPLR